MQLACVHENHLSILSTFNNNGCHGIEPLPPHFLGQVGASNHMKKSLHSVDEEGPKLNDDDKKVAYKEERGDGAILDVRQLK